MFITFYWFIARANVFQHTKWKHLLLHPSLLNVYVLECEVEDNKFNLFLYVYFPLENIFATC